MDKVNILLVDEDANDLEPLKDFFHPINAEFFLSSDSADASEQFEIHKPKLSLVSLKLAHANEWQLLKQLNDSLTPIIGLIERDQAQWRNEGQTNGIDAYLAKPLDPLHLQIYFPSVLSQIWPCKNHTASAKDRRSCYDRRTTAMGRRWYDELYQTNNFEGADKQVITAGPFIIDKAKKSVNRNGKNLNLSPKEWLLSDICG